MVGWDGALAHRPWTGAPPAPPQRHADAGSARTRTGAGAATGGTEQRAGAVGVGGHRPAASARRKPGVRRQPDLETTFLRSHEFSVTRAGGVSLYVLGGGKKRRKSPWDTNCHFLRPPFSLSPKSVKLKKRTAYVSSEAGVGNRDCWSSSLESQSSFSSPSPALLSRWASSSVGPRHPLPLGSHQSCRWERVQATQRGDPGGGLGPRGAERALKGTALLSSL